MSVFAWHVLFDELELAKQVCQEADFKESQQKLAKIMINSAFGSARMTAFDWSNILYGLSCNFANYGSTRNRKIISDIIKKSLGKEEEKENEDS